MGLLLTAMAGTAALTLRTRTLMPTSIRLAATTRGRHSTDSTPVIMSADTSATLGGLVTTLRGGTVDGVTDSAGSEWGRLTEVLRNLGALPGREQRVPGHPSGLTYAR